jgi:hypothetical protein
MVGSDMSKRLCTTVVMLVYVACLGMGACYMTLLQFGTAEEALLQALKTTL